MPATDKVVTFEFEESKPRNLWVDAGRQLMRNKLAVVGMIIIVILFFIAIFGPALAPYDPLKQELLRTSQPPSRDHWLGTDELGRDMLSRLLYGARTAVLIAFIVESISLVVGVLMGGIGAYMGGWADELIMRACDAIRCFPNILLASFTHIALKPLLERWAESLYEVSHWQFLTNQLMIDYLVVFGVLGLVAWPRKARLIRSQILSLREEDFVLAARSVGASNWAIIIRHLVPNSLGAVIVNVTAGLGSVMLLESSLSYLGVGIQPPGASWGTMIFDSMSLWRYMPHLVLGPGITLAVVIFAFNFLGDGLTDALNPQRHRG